MRKTLSLLLALIMCIGIFAACGEEKEPAAKDPVDSPADKPEDKPSEPADPNVTIAHFDMTESYTLVIEKAGTVGDERIGVRCGAGKIQAGTYNTSGKKRTASWEFDFASLGLEGHSWEYLGATVEINTADPSNPKIINTPVKSTFAVKTADLKFPDDLTCELPNGIKVNLPTLNYGILRPNNLLNEGGWFIPGWNDKTTILNAQNNHFVNPNYIQEWAIFTICDYKGKECNMYIHTNTDIAAHAIEIENGSATPDTPATPETPTVPDTPSTPSVPDAPVTPGTSVVPTSGAKEVVLVGDFLLGLNAIDGTLQTLLGEDYAVKGHGYNSTPSTNASRLELYELFVFDTATNACKGWMPGGKRAQTVKTLLEENEIEYLVITPGRRETLKAEDNARYVQVLNAVKFLAETYPDTKLILVSEQPYPDETFEMTTAPDKTSTIGTNQTGSTQVEHNDLIKAFVKACADVVPNSVIVNLGDAFIEAGKQNVAVYDTHELKLTLANENGSYLLASMLYKTITGQSPIGLPAAGGVDTATAIALQNLFRSDVYID